MWTLHAANRMIGAGLHEPGFSIEDVVTHVDTEDFANDEAIVTNLDDAVAAAFKAGGRFSDAWRLNDAAGHGGEAGMQKFVFTLWK